MTTFLPVSRDVATDHQKSCFPLVKSMVFETKRNTLKSTISES